MIDWSELVAHASTKLPECGPQAPNSDMGCRNKPIISDIVGMAETRASIGFEDVYSDIPTHPTDFEWSRVEGNENNNQSSFFKPVGGGLQGQSAPSEAMTFLPSCKTCAHLRRPGLSDGLCSGRDDLTHAYTPAHPLCQLPTDDGASCTVWCLHPAFVGAAPA